MIDEPKYLNVRQAARRLHVHENTVRNWANEGRLPVHRYGKRQFRRFLESDIGKLCAELDGAEAPSYHDLHITTRTLPRTKISNLPFGVEVTCCRVSGWKAWRRPMGGGEPISLGGEYDGEDWLVLDVAGHVICDSRPAAEELAERLAELEVSRG